MFCLLVEVLKELMLFGEFTLLEQIVFGEVGKQNDLIVA
jgi:hypothetical protein